MMLRSVLVLVSDEFAALKALAAGPRHHLALDRRCRRAIGRLWMQRAVRLDVGDIWKITRMGAALLSDHNGFAITIH